MQYKFLKDEYFQWDTGQIIELYPDGEDEITHLHMYNDRIGGPALPIEVETDDDGTKYAEIPDLLFRVPGRILLWGVISNQEGTSTVDECTGILVNRRPKPTDYVYVDPDIPSYKELLLKFEALNEEYEQKLDNGELKGADGKDGKDGKDGADGKDGTDGFSPQIELRGTTGGNLLMVTDKDGKTTSVIIHDGKDGKDGLPGKDGKSAVVIEESNPEIMDFVGTMLETKLTPAEAIEAIRCGGLLLKVMAPSTGEFYIFLLTTLFDYSLDETPSVELAFQRSVNGITTTLTISVAADGSMIVADVQTEETQANDGLPGKDGEDGERGTGILYITTAPSSYTTQTGGFTPVYRIALSTVLSQSKADNVLVGDTLFYSYYHYPVGYVDGSYVYLGTRKSIRGETGAAGAAGVDGKSAYAYAQDGGYDGTEDEFAKKLANGEGNNYVTAYGAKGDGVTDDTSAFQSALASERVVFVPGGTYKLSAGLVIRPNCCLELSQDTVLNFTNTDGNCIEMRSSSTIRGNHAIINVPYAFAGHVIDAVSTHDTATGVVPYTGWTPMWKHGRYVYDICIIKTNSYGTQESVDGKNCCGTGIYLSGDGNNEVRFLWGALLQGIRICGAFARGIHAINFDLEGKEDSAWNHDMRIEAVIQCCEIGVDLSNCNDVHLAVAVQPSAARNKTPYAKWGVYLNDCRYIDMSSSVIWDWNASNSLYTPGGQYTTVAMVGNCCGLVYNDFGYYTNSTLTRDRIYTDTPSNLKKMTIMQEPIDAIFKVIDGVPHFANGSINEKLVSDKDLAQYFQTDYVKGFTDVLATATGTDGSIYNGIGYKKGVYVTANNGTEGTSSYYTTTGFIPCSNGDKVYVKDMSMKSDNAGYARIVMYNSNKEYITVVNRPNLIDNASSYCGYSETDNGCVFTIGTIAAISGVAFVRITVNNSCMGDAPMVAINQEIKYTVEGFLADGVKVKAENVLGDVASGGGIPYIVGDSTTAGVWTGTYEGITEYYEGLTVLYKLNVAGVSGGSTLNINNLGAVSVKRNASTAVTTTYPVGSVVMLTYSGGAWLTADYDVDSRNTAGTAATSNTKLFVVGSRSQNANGVTTNTNSGVYIGTDNELYSNGKKVAHADEIPEGGSIDVTAEVGQTIVVKEVDENGKPTKWESAEYYNFTDEIIPKTTFTPQYNESFGVYSYGDHGELNAKNALEVGREYTVIFDGIKYVCTAKTTTAMGISVIFIGNGMIAGLENTGEPFVLASTIVDGAVWDGIVFMGFNANSHAIRLITHRIPEHYLPSANFAPFYIEFEFEDDKPVCINSVSEVEEAFYQGRQLIVRVKDKIFPNTSSDATLLFHLFCYAQTDFGIGFIFYSYYAQTTNAAQLALVPTTDGTYEKL